MKTYLYLILIFAFLGTNFSSNAQKKSKYFSNLNKFENKEWLTGNFEISKAFEESYNAYYHKKNFKKHLYKYVGIDLDKIYWIATYLNDDYYNEIKNESLSFELFKYGVAISKAAQESKQIRFLFVVGKAYYHKGEKDKSLEYLLPAYKLSQQYPGNVPTWNSAEEADEIYDFIKSQY